MKWLAQAKMKVRGHNIVYIGEDDKNERDGKEMWEEKHS